jgi:hypothetical protein
MWIFKCIVYVTYNSSVFKCVIVWQNSNQMYWRYILLLKVHSHVSSHSLLSWCLFVCSGSWLTLFFWIILYDSYLNVLILNSFLVSLCYPFVLQHQTITFFPSDSINKFWVTAAGDIPFFLCLFSFSS